jgi:predicted HTH transcriptional regulator
MKVSILIAKLQQFHPDSELTEIDVWRLFDNDAVAREIDARFERVRQYLASGDLDGLREFIEAEKAKSRA